MPGESEAGLVSGHWGTEAGNGPWLRGESLLVNSKSSPYPWP